MLSVRKRNVMSDKPKAPKKSSITESGMIPRINLEPNAPKEPPRPTTLPEMRDIGATTGIMPVITEGEDISAERDDDSADGQ